MTDIEDRLRLGMGHVSFERTMQEAAAEIGRLRARQQRMTTTLEECTAEIARLREQITGRSGYEFVSSMAEMSDAMTRQRLEIERLHTQIREMRSLFVILILTLLASWVTTWLAYYFFWK